ncbi:blastoderm-specific protein 25D [Anopheles ziemanni]|uniref:blastoderm-specific protein 25D n=1 Tax=Anopheles coustani TaxID=139045 RepID=UPI00265B1584|nr:blastoderm-specific protein 25D [Anopheles coustani]XP_058168428.1 blastoderm-specific protein 25D [Anopheles ziemanni]
MALSSNIYEQKLYHMFQSHGNGDGSNSLDREALVKLCRTLELKERGHLLVKCLLTDAKTRVSFREFREGLLHILGGNEDSLGGENLQKSTSVSTNATEGYGEPYNDTDHQLQQQQQHQQEQQSAISCPSVGSTCSSDQTSHTVTSGSSSSKVLSSTSGHLSTSTAFLPDDESSGDAEEKLHHHRDSNAPLITQKSRQKYPSKQQQLLTAGDKEGDNGVSVDENKFANGQQNTSVLYTTVQSKTLLPSGADDGDESSDREVSPKFVVGTKKYGRRSRPREDVNGFDRLSQSSNSDNESVAALNTSTNTDAASVNILSSADGGGGTKVQRSASQSDIHGSKRRRPHVGPGAIRLKRCASLPTHRQRPGTTTTAASKVHPAQLQMDDERIDQKIYFMNLSENLRDIWDSLLVDCDPGRRHGDLLNQSQLQQVCERVGLQKTPARLAAQEVFSKLSLQPIEGISFTEFIALLESNTDLLPMGHENRELQLGDCDDSGTLLSSASVGPAHDKSFTLAMPDWTSDIGSLAASIIIDMWEAAGIVAPAILLNELGFDGDVIQVSDLVLALEEEHQRMIGGHLNTSSLSSTSSNVNDASLIVRASLALHKAEVNALRQAFHQLVEENKKLYADNKEVNNRAVLLAQEIDERHNSLENSTRTKIRHLEQRHHETIKELSTQLAFEREQLSHANAMLEKRIALLEGEEGKLKAELSRVSDENEELRQEQENLTKEITDLLEKNIKLNRDIAELEENNRNDYPEDDDCGFARKDSEEVLDLIDRISLLQGENTGLRDKNDELNVEIEMLNAELSKIKLKRNSTSDETDRVVGGDTAAGQTAIKRRGDSPSKTRLSDESPRLGKFRKCSIDNDTEVDPCSGDWMALHSELGQSGRPSEEVSTVLSGCPETSASSGISSINDSSLTRDEEIKALRCRVEELQQQLRSGKKEADSVDQASADKPGESVSAKEQECVKLKARCEELEASLEQMRKEYEDCEDYWQAKVNDERLLYEEEQRVSDEKFTELLKKVSEYEEQFAGNAKPEKDGRLSPIDEKDGLEQQYLELEADFEQAQLALEEKTHEVEKLLRRIQELEQMTKYPSEMLLSPSPHMETPEVEDRPASSPISYLWNQSTIQRPVRDYQNPNWRPPPTKASEINTVEECGKFPKSSAASEAARDTDGGESDVSVSSEGGEANFARIISPIQKPITANNGGGESGIGTRDEYSADGEKPSVGMVAGLEQLEVSDTCSVKSVRSTHSLASTHSIQNSECAGMTLPVSAEHMKHLRLVQQQLQGEITDLTHERDCLLMELQQLKEAKPIIARAYTKTATHPNQMQKIQNLEQKNRHLQSMIKQQQQYTESVLHQIWQQQRGEINELRNRLEAQCIVISDQATRLASNDILVKDMYEENSRLMLQVKRLEHQCLRATWLNQMNQAPSSSPAPSTNHHSQGLSGIMPGLP